MTWELRVALRYLTARRKQAFISLISGVAVLGVAVGVAAVLIALGLMTGLQSEIRARILGATAHVSVFRAGGGSSGDLGALVAKVRGRARGGGRGTLRLREGAPDERDRRRRRDTQGHRAGAGAHRDGRRGQAQRGERGPARRGWCGEGPTPILLGARLGRGAQRPAWATW